MNDLYMNAHLVYPPKEKKSAMQDWVLLLPIMQQSVLMSAIRGPDGIAKRHKCKNLIRWYRRCILISAFDGVAINNPYDPGGGSFTGPVSSNSTHELEIGWERSIKKHEDNFLDSRDELPFHYILHFIHAIQIVGNKHPNDRIANYWLSVYSRIVFAMHLREEGPRDMDIRLSDNEQNWRMMGDNSTTCSD